MPLRYAFFGMTLYFVIPMRRIVGLESITEYFKKLFEFVL